MSRGGTLPLLYPFETGQLDWAQTGRRTLYLNARSDLLPPADVLAEALLVQPSRPEWLRLRAAGIAPSPVASGDGYDAALVSCGRDRGAAELTLADALERTRTDALIVVAGAKDDGIASLRRRIAAHLRVDGAVPKHHGLAFWFQVPPNAREIAAAMREPHPAGVVAGRFETAPGMFSHGHLDEGSRLLAERLPPDLAGRAADFGAGWGYLSSELIARCPGVLALDLYEADFWSLEAARGNLAEATIPLGFHWHDLTGEPVEARYDAIVTNPPFHVGRAAEPALGQAFIAAAARVLKPGGRLVMVANRQLPYEATIDAHFRRHAEVGGNGRFKVIEAVR